MDDVEKAAAIGGVIQDAIDRLQAGLLAIGEPQFGVLVVVRAGEYGTVGGRNYDAIRRDLPGMLAAFERDRSKRGQ